MTHFSFMYTLLAQEFIAYQEKENETAQICIERHHEQEEERCQGWKKSCKFSKEYGFNQGCHQLNLTENLTEKWPLN